VLDLGLGPGQADDADRSTRATELLWDEYIPSAAPGGVEVMESRQARVI
jgi:hypothetical protein